MVRKNSAEATEKPTPEPEPTLEGFHVEPDALTDAPELVRVINCNPSGGSITDENGKRILPGGLITLPIVQAESLVSRGICRYEYRHEAYGK